MARHRTRRSRRMSRRGGMRFNYTIDEQRKAWTEAIYPYGAQLIVEVGKIPWQSYSYSGYTSMGDWSGHVTEIRVTAKAPANTPYAFIGGAACEIYGREYPSLNIQKWVDPTADLDVKVSYPDVTVADDDLTEVIKEGIGLTDDYSDWLWNQAYFLCRRASPPLCATARFSPPTLADIQADNELRVADRIDRVGNVLITRCSVGNMVKVQLTTTVDKVLTTHFLELIIPVEESEGANLKPTHPKYSNIERVWGGKVLVESIPKTFADQVNALISRHKSGVGPDKVANHVARIRYLAALLAYLKKEVYYGFFWKFRGLMDLKILSPEVTTEVLSNLRQITNPPSGFDSYFAPKK